MSGVVRCKNETWLGGEERYQGLAPRMGKPEGLGRRGGGAGRGAAGRGGWGAWKGRVGGSSEWLGKIGGGGVT